MPGSPILETGNAGSACAPCASRHGTGAEPEAGADSGLQQAAWRRPQRLRAVLPRRPAMANPGMCGPSRQAQAGHNAGWRDTEAASLWSFKDRHIPQRRMEICLFCLAPLCRRCAENFFHFTLLLRFALYTGKHKANRANRMPAMRAKIVCRNEKQSE